MKNSISIPQRVEWGDCDPAGIVFYPNFFAYFDRATWALFLLAGLSLEAMRQEYGAVGVPVVDAQATFSVPCRFQDTLTLTATISAWGRTSFTLTHEIHNGEALAVTGREVRIWGLPHPTVEGRLKAGAIPADVIARFQG
jgi:4-hydroxybenzoyl-CoA thioesterase